MEDSTEGKSCIEEFSGGGGVRVFCSGDAAYAEKWEAAKGGRVVRVLGIGDAAILATGQFEIIQGFNNAYRCQLAATLFLVCGRRSVYEVLPAFTEYGSSTLRFCREGLPFMADPPHMILGPRPLVFRSP